MTAMHLFYLLSSAGALAFFLGGYLTRLIRTSGSDGEQSNRAREELARLSPALLAASARATALESEKSDLLQQFHERGALCASLEVEVSQLRADAAQAESSGQSLEAERALRQEAEQAHMDARRSLSRTLQELGDARKLLSSERALHLRCEQDVARTRSQLKASEEERSKLATRLVVTSRELEARRAIEPELKRVQEECERLEVERNELATAVARRSQTELDPEVLQARLDMSIAQIQRVQKENEGIKRRLGEALDQAARLRDELAVAADSAREAERARAEMSSLAQAQDTLSEELSEVRKRLTEANLEAENAGFRALAAEALAEEATKKRAVLDAEMRTMRGRLESAEAKRAEVERLRTECQSLREQHRHLGDLEQQLATDQVQLRELRIRLSTAESKVAVVDKIEGENAALREQAEAARDTTHLLSATEKEARELRQRVQAADSKLADLERIVEENRGLRDRLAEREGYDKLVAEHDRVCQDLRRAKLECELFTRRVKELELEQVEFFEARAKISELTLVAAEVPGLRRRTEELEAQLFSGGRHPESAVVPKDSGEMPVAPGKGATPLEEMLGSLLVGSDGVQSAALADRQGLLVASAGETGYEEGLAAFAGLADEFAARARTLLPLGNVLRVCLHDANHVEASCRFFLAAGAEYGMTTVARTESERRKADDAIAELSRALAGRRAAVAETGTA